MEWVQNTYQTVTMRIFRPSDDEGVRDYLFLRDGASSHTATAVAAYSGKAFPEALKRPATSTELNLLDDCHLKVAIQDAYHEFDLDATKKMSESMGKKSCAAHGARGDPV